MSQQQSIGHRPSLNIDAEHICMQIIWLCIYLKAKQFKTGPLMIKKKEKEK